MALGVFKIEQTTQNVNWIQHSKYEIQIETSQLEFDFEFEFMLRI